MAKSSGKKKRAASGARARVVVPAVEHTPVEDMRQRGRRALGLIAAIEAEFPKLLQLTEGERRSAAKLRDGEDQALHAVLDVADARPELFASLADKDHGDDPARFETQLLRDRLGRREVLEDVRARLSELHTKFADTILRINDLVRPPLLEGYDIVKPVAKRDAVIRTKLAPALDFYAAPARARARNRKRGAKPTSAAAGK